MLGEKVGKSAVAYIAEKLCVSHNIAEKKQLAEYEYDGCNALNSELSDVFGGSVHKISPKLLFFMVNIRIIISEICCDTV